MFRLNVPNVTPLVKWARKHKEGIALVEYNEADEGLYFEIHRPGERMEDIARPVARARHMGEDAYAAVRMVLMTGYAKSTARAGGRGVNREATGNDPTRLAAQSDDVVTRKQAVLRNFLAHSFPECLSEGRIDIESLRNALGDWVAGGTERFGLVWPGKAQCMRVIQEPSTATLQPDRDESLDFDAASNVFIEGDNLKC